MSTASHLNDHADHPLCCAHQTEDGLPSSGLIKRKRLNPRGDRLANEALWRIVMVRMSSEPRTRAYVQRRTIEGKSKREIIRCLKRDVAREVFKDLKRPLDNQ